MRILILLCSLAVVTTTFAAKPVCPWSGLTKPTVISGTAHPQNGLSYSEPGDFSSAACLTTDLGGLAISASEVEGAYFIYNSHAGLPIAPTPLTPAQLQMCILDVRQLCQASGFAFPVNAGNG